ncbi:zinc ribbon domain-containing protein [Oceanobacillus kapialis]|uniref:Zinc ribbon domain-containing protein n=1 Tax=Oceanobacillus kapialis TaxID=481353 RepID=A0ABW5Q344_9BACI
MAYCKNCGGEVAPDARFCKHCGKEIEQEGVASENTGHTYYNETEQGGNEQVPSTPQNQHQPNQPSTPSKGKKLNKKSKIILFSSAALILILIGVYAVGNMMSSPKHLLDKFQAAIEDEDAAELASILTTEEEELEITEESVAGIIQLYNNKSSQFKELMSNLQYQAEGDTGQLGMYPIDFIEDGKKFGFFDDYKLSVNPVFFEVGTNYKDTEIIVNDEVVATADSDSFNQEIGPFLPGEYTIRATHDTGFFNLEAEKTIAGDPLYASYVDLFLEADNVTFDLMMKGYDELNSVKLFVNGKDTGKDLTKEERVGPLLTDGSMNVSFEAEFPWGTMKTNDYPLTERYMEFNFGNSDEFKKQIQDVLVAYNEEFTEAYATGNPEALNTAVQDLETMIVEESAYNKENDIVYEGAFHGLDVYQDSFTLEKSYEGFWELTVDTITYYEEAMYQKGDEAELEQMEEEMRYYLAYDPQLESWFVRGMDYPGSMPEDRMERITVEEPVFHTSNTGKKEE